MRGKAGRINSTAGIATMLLHGMAHAQSVILLSPSAQPSHSADTLASVAVKAIRASVAAAWAPCVMCPRSRANVKISARNGRIVFSVIVAR